MMNIAPSVQVVLEQAASKLLLHEGTSVYLSSTARAWGCAASTADLVSSILAMTTPR